MAKKRRRVAKKRKKNAGGAGWRNSPITGGLAVFVILLCLYFSFGPSGSSGFKMDYVCTDCRQVFREPALREIPPHECFKCDKKALWPAIHCFECGRVSAVLPPLAEYGCSSCGHTAEDRIPGMQPHDCPKCSTKDTYSETLLCMPCDKSFVPSNDNEELTCPECQGYDNIPSLEPIQTCEHCDSEDMVPLTPYAVIRWEMGKSLNAKQEEEVEDWKRRQESE